MGKTYLTPRKLYRILHRIADRNIGAVERAFLDSVRVAVGAIKTERLADALARGDVAGALDAVRINGQLSAEIKRRIEHALQRAFVQAAFGSAAVVVPGMQRAGILNEQIAASITFDLVNPRAVRWAQVRAAELVREVDAATRTAVRRIIVRGLRDGVTVAQSQRAIAARLALDVATTMGLTKRQFSAVENLRARLQAAGTPAAEASVGADRYASKLLRQRAMTIARTETVLAANSGNEEMVRAAVARGLAGIGEVRRWWLVTPDDRLCEICRAIPGMNPDGVGLDEPYRTPRGPVMTPGGVHPNDRCSEQIRVVVVDAPMREAA